MEILSTLLEYALHIDVKLFEFVRAYHMWTYLVLFLIIFCETGLVVTPFLPGDSLLFATGAVAGAGELRLVPLMALLFVAAVLGDAVNFFVGQRLGAAVFDPGRKSLINRNHLLRTQAFFERHGGKTIVLARFVPIVRTFAPFVAGVAGMRYRLFAAYNLLGGAIWVGSLVLLGYFFGNLPVVKRNFSLVIYAIIIVSVLPVVVEFVRSSAKSRTSLEKD